LLLLQLMSLPLRASIIVSKFASDGKWKLTWIPRYLVPFPFGIHFSPSSFPHSQDFLSQPHFGAKCEKATHTPKSGKMESSGTPKNSKDDLRGRISLPWCVFYINGKLLKCRCPKWARIAHLDICSPSYGQKKGRESNY
jgi:hypothetical protein